MYLFLLHSGISFYFIDSTNGYIYTTFNNGSITRYNARLNRIITITNSDVVISRPTNISLISVDWVNKMLYWLETVNNTHVAVSIDVVCGKTL